MRNTMLRKGLCLALLLGTMLSNPAFAQSPKSWTTVGSAGTVNDEDTALVELGGGGIARLENSAPAGTTAHIRYNVVAVDGLFGLGSPKRMRVRYQDNGSDAQVTVQLFEYDFANGGAPNLLMDFDSNNFASAPQLQTRSLNACGVEFDFTNKVYYLEVTLSRSAATGYPMLAAIQLSALPGSCAP